MRGWRVGGGCGDGGGGCCGGFDGEILFEVELAAALLVALTPGVGHFFVPVGAGDAAEAGIGF